MGIHLKSLEDAAAAIGNAMERACVSGDMETAERHFERFRALFADYEADKLASGAIERPVLGFTPSSSWVKVMHWW